MPAGSERATRWGLEVRRDRPGRWDLLLAGLVLAVLAAPFLVRAGVLPAGLLACPFRSATSIPCPTCGTTRAFLALARFDLRGALAVSPFGTFFFFLLAFYVTGTALGLCGLPRPGLSARASRWFWLVVVVVTFATWAIVQL